MPDLIRVTDETTRADLAETLGHLAAHAKRQPYVVRRFDSDPLTSWDKAHAQIDAVLTDWQAAG